MRLDVLKMIAKPPASEPAPIKPPVVSPPAIQPVSAAFLQRQAEADQHTAAIMAMKPDWATAAIMANLEQLSPEAIYDNFHMDVVRSAIIGWRRGQRDCFKQLRAAAATFPETADLATAPASAEHRQKYSFGKGYFLRSQNSAWRVFYDKWSDQHPLRFGASVEIHLPKPAVEKPSPSDAPADLSNLPAMSIVTVWHTRRNANTWVVRPAERVDRNTYLALLDRAKTMGGWYSSYGPMDTRGFMFLEQTAAEAFANLSAAAPEPAATAVVATACAATPEPLTIVTPAPSAVIPLPQIESLDWRLAMAGLA